MFTVGLRERLVDERVRRVGDGDRPRAVPADPVDGERARRCGPRAMCLAAHSGLWQGAAPYMASGSAGAPLASTTAAATEARGRARLVWLSKRITLVILLG